MTTDKNRATIMDACQSISRSADALKDCHTVDGDWGDDLDAKACYNAELQLLGRLTALLDDSGQPGPCTAVTAAARDVLAERRRQIDQEGWTPAHDDAHSTGDIALAAACYAVADNENYPPAEPPDLWPWNADWWKPSTERRNLVKAGALILAEIERLDRSGGAS